MPPALRAAHGSTVPQAGGRRTDDICGMGCGMDGASDRTLVGHRPRSETGVDKPTRSRPNIRADNMFRVGIVGLIAPFPRVVPIAPGLDARIIGIFGSDALQQRSNGPHAARLQQGATGS